jgi:hypothetical protein
MVDMVGLAIEAEVSLAYPSSGLTWQLTAPAGRVCGPLKGAKVAVVGHSQQTSVDGCKSLAAPS